MHEYSLLRYLIPSFGALWVELMQLGHEIVERIELLILLKHHFCVGAVSVGAAALEWFVFIVIVFI